MMKKLLIGVLGAALACCLLGLVACKGGSGKSHKSHDYSDVWVVRDEDGHARKCTGCDSVSKKTKHNYDEGVTYPLPTCSEEGVITYTCLDCGYVMTDSVKAIGHAYDDGIVTKETSCKEEGVKTYTCLVCGHKKTESIDKAQHAYDDGTVTKETSCKEEGVKTYTCLVCGHEKTESIDKAAHDYEYDSDDVNHWQKCKDCGATTEEVEHTYDEGIITKETSCKEEGIKTYTCSVCEHQKTESIDKEEHDYDEGTITETPTCTAEGTKTYTCLVCGHEKTETVPKAKHRYSEENAVITKQPTCTEEGVITYPCLDCGNAITDVIEKAEHGYDEGAITKEPTCTEEGVKTYTCSACGHEKTETVDKIEHDYEYDSDDVNHWQKCKNCDATMEEVEHTYDEGTITKETSCSEEGIKTYTCSVCEHQKTEPVEKTAHDYGYDSDDVNHWQKCKECGATTEEVEHTYDEGTITKETSCSEEGIKTYTCSVCEHQKTESVEKAAHDYEYDSDDVNHWQVCKNCDATTEEVEHDFEDASDDGYHWQQCATCDKEANKAAHSGGVATRTQKAVCTTCHNAYGEVNPTAVELSLMACTSGSFTQVTPATAKSAVNSIAYMKNNTLAYGTLTAVIDLNGASGDNGIIFGLSNPNNLAVFWEQNVSYYFFFLTDRGSAYLGKVNQGWMLCQEVYLSNFSNTKTYTLKVERTEDEGIKCYVDGALTITYNEVLPLTGTGYGLRAGGANVIYTSLSCQSHGTIQEPTEGVLTTVKGSVVGTDTAVRTTANDTLALLDGTFTSGTYSLYVNAMNNGHAGAVFGYTANDYYLFYVNRAAQRVELAHFVNGNKTVLYSNYLSAGYSEGGSYLMRVVVKDGKAYCYFFNTLYTVQNVTLAGSGAGVYAEKAGAQFHSYNISSQADITDCDTLIFGHSYTELWDDWREDFASIDGLGKIVNIGIGGSVAAHWYDFREGIVTYNPVRGFYWIGINDLTGGVSPYLVVETVRDTLLYIKENIPAFTVTVLSTNYCPSRDHIRSEIAETNVLMRRLAAEYDWITYVEMESAFTNEQGASLSKWFKDELHPTAEAYSNIVIPAIKRALNGEGQPELSDEDAAEILWQAKEIKKLEIADYSIDGFRDDEWTTAEPIYNQALALIEACTSKEEVWALNLSAYVDQLKEIKHNTQYVYEETFNQNVISSYETNNFRDALNSSSNGSFNMHHDGHRLINTVQYTDLSFTFRLSDITNEFATVGILFRAKQTATLGIDGYYLNLVTQENYLQVWYFNNGYGQGAGVHEYLGGWVFTGEVEETLFRAVIKGNTAYIYTEESYLAKGAQAYGCAVDLTGGGRFAPYTSGGLGVMSWNSYNGATGKLTVSKITSPACHSTAEERLAKAKADKIKEIEQNDALSYRPEEWKEAETIYESAVVAINACTTVEQVKAFDLTQTKAALAAIKTNTQLSYEELTANEDTIYYETDAFANTLKASTGGKYSLTDYGHRILNKVQYGDMSFTFRMSDNVGDIIGRLGGLLFRARQNITGGVDGYLINFVSTETQQFVQLLYCSNACPQHGGAEAATYIGGWDYTPFGSVAGTLFRAVVTGDKLFICTEEAYSEYGFAAAGVSISLNGNDLGHNFPVYTSGGIGLLNWGFTFNMEINDIRGTFTVENDTKTAVNGILAKDENCIVFNGANITAGADGTVRLGGMAYSIYNGIDSSDFNFTVRLSELSTPQTADVGILFRAKKHEGGTGIDGYIISFNNLDGHEYIQIFYLQNFLCNAGEVAPEPTYLGGWVFTDPFVGQSVIDRDFHVSVGGQWVCFGYSNVGIVVDLTANGSIPLMTESSIGVLVNREGFTGTLTLKDVYLW